MEEKPLGNVSCKAKLGQVLGYGFPTRFGLATEEGKSRLKRHTGTKENETEGCLTYIKPPQQKTNE